MKIQDLPWITHTHTDYYDVCRIYNGEMPDFLWGKKFWDNHFYLINKEHYRLKEKLNLPGSIFYYDEDLPYPIRLINILSNIDSELIVFDHEDMILYKKANLEKINKSIDLMLINNIDSIRFLKNDNARFIKIDDESAIEIIDPKSKWIFSIQSSIWRKDVLIKILKKNIFSNMWQLESRSQKVIKNLKVKCAVLSGFGKKRGLLHFDSTYYPYIATAIFKGKWTTSEYETELNRLFKKYSINPSQRGETRNY